MPLSEEERTRILGTLYSKGINPVCPICQGKEWTMGPFVVTANEIDLNKKTINIGNSLPSIPLICNKCGYIAYIAAGTLGLLPKKEQAQS